MAQAVASTSAVITSRPLQWYHRLFATLIYSFIRLLSALISYRWEDRSGLFTGRPRSPVIFCIWHNRLALSLEVKRVYLSRVHSALPLAALVSASKDGGILARVLERYGAQPVRGSTSRRGRQALLELTRWAQNGYDLAITPDGPRGPRYVVQPGVISLAQVTGHLIVPVSYHLTGKSILRSWDAFQVPLPFTRCVMTLGEPLRVPRDASEQLRNELRQQLQQYLVSITRD